MLVSFIIPAYNSESFICKTLDCLKNQSCFDFEAIIIDDGSFDNTYNFVLDYIKNNKLDNFKVIKIKNLGVSNARNVGLSNCSGKYVVFLDSDDIVEYNMVESLQNINVDFIYWNFNYKYNDEILYTSLNIHCLDKYELIKSLLKIENKIQIGTFACSKNIIDKNNLKFNTNCTYGEDYEFIYKAIYFSNTYLYVDKVLHNWIKRDNSVTNSISIKDFSSIYALYNSKQLINIEFLNKYFNDFIFKIFLGNVNRFIRFNYEKNRKITINYCKKIKQEVSNVYGDIYCILKKCKKDISFKNRLLYFIFNYFSFIYNLIVIFHYKLKG